MFRASYIPNSSRGTGNKMNVVWGAGDDIHTQTNSLIPWTFDMPSEIKDETGNEEGIFVYRDLILKPVKTTLKYQSTIPNKLKAWE